MSVIGNMHALEYVWMHMNILRILDIIYDFGVQ